MSIIMEISATHSALPGLVSAEGRISAQGQIAAQARFSPKANNQIPADVTRQNGKTGSGTTSASKHSPVAGSASSDDSNPGNKPVTDKNALNQRELQEIEALKARDIEVKAHERAHIAAAGSLAVSGASFSYSQGPDGRRYATSGEVRIDTSKVPDDPQATISKAQQLRRAALAPATPSAQDRSIAAEASAMEQQARLELVQSEKEEPAEAEKQSAANDENHTEPPQTTHVAQSQNKPLYSDEVDAGKYLDTFA
jgi:hypothetical protein